MEFLNESTIAASDLISSINFRHMPNITQTNTKHSLHMAAINANRLTIGASTEQTLPIDTAAAHTITDTSFIKLLS
jgi:hypothetical protein